MRRCDLRKDKHTKISEMNRQVYLVSLKKNKNFNKHKT